MLPHASGSHLLFRPIMSTKIARASGVASLTSTQHIAATHSRFVAPQPGQPHPSQGILATSATGAACSVYYLYGAAQAVALAARASGTPFDPRSFDLPSIGSLVGFYHACLDFPVKQTWLDAIKAGNCDIFEGLSYSNAAKYC